MGVIEYELPNICFPVLMGGSSLPPLHPLLGELWDPPLWTLPSPGLTKLFLVPLSHCVIKPRPTHSQPYRLKHHPFTVKLQCIETSLSLQSENLFPHSSGSRVTFMVPILWPLLGSLSYIQSSALFPISLGQVFVFSELWPSLGLWVGLQCPGHSRCWGLQVWSLLAFDQS